VTGQYRFRKCTLNELGDANPKPVELLHLMNNCLTGVMGRLELCRISDDVDIDAAREEFKNAVEAISRACAHLDPKWSRRLPTVSPGAPGHLERESGNEAEPGRTTPRA
jgi:hypothetical protein